MNTTQRSFGELNFGEAELGDQRRTRRLVAAADEMLRHPGGTLPHKLKSPPHLKALYRLLECEKVTHQAVLAPHQQRTLERVAESDDTVLILHDGTELDFTSRKSLKELGQIGNGGQRGYICHNSLAIEAKTRTVIGLANQLLYQRVKVPKTETRAEAQQRQSRESRLWLTATQPLPSSWQLVDVCDRLADTFEFLDHEAHSGRRFVIRAAKDRQILPGHEPSEREKPCRLFAYLKKQPSLGERTVAVAAKEGQPARQARVSVSAAAVRLLPPKQPRGEHGDKPLEVWTVLAWETDPPRGVEPLQWILLTNQPARNLREATMVLQWYEARWVIEEYHKAMKTGCGVETFQFQYEERLQPAIALVSVVATQLLNLRDASRQADAKTRLATELFAAEYTEILSGWRYKQVRDNLTIHEFFYALARLGGHQNRKRDHLPGWLVLWRGWTTLQAMVEGAEAYRRKKCG